MHLLKVGWAFLFASVKSILLGIFSAPLSGSPGGIVHLGSSWHPAWLLLTERAIWVANPSCPTTRLSGLLVASPTVTGSIPWLPTGLFPVVTVVTRIHISIIHPRCIKEVFSDAIYVNILLYCSYRPIINIPLHIYPSLSMLVFFLSLPVCMYVCIYLSIFKR